MQVFIPSSMFSFGNLIDWLIEQDESQWKYLPSSKETLLHFVRIDVKYCLLLSFLKFKRRFFKIWDKNELLFYERSYLF